MRDIVESGVNFGPYAEDNLFYIEKSDLYKSLGAGIKTTEFVLRANELEPAILFVEAKTNAPNPEMIPQRSEKSSRSFIPKFPKSSLIHLKFIPQLC